MNRLSYKYDFELSSKSKFFLWMYYVIPNIDIINKEHIFALIETWHTKQDVDLLEITGYRCYNICRPRAAHAKGRPSGGIAVYVKNFIRAGVSQCPTKSTENVFLKLKKTFFWYRE